MFLGYRTTYRYCKTENKNPTLENWEFTIILEYFKHYDNTIKLVYNVSTDKPYFASLVDLVYSVGTFYKTGWCLIPSFLLVKQFRNRESIANKFKKSEFVIIF